MTKFPVSVSLGPSPRIDCARLLLLDDSKAERTEELIVELRLTDPDLAGQVTISPSMTKIKIQDNDAFEGELGKCNAILFLFGIIVHLRYCCWFC